VFQAADSIIAVGEEMADRIKGTRFPASHISVVHNWVDEDHIRPIHPSLNMFWREQGLERKFVVLYAGNFGRAHLFDELLAAAGRLRDQPDIAFLLVGSGNQEDRIRLAVKKQQLSNVRVHPYVPFHRLAEMLSAGSVGIVTQKAETAGLLVPCKLYGLMAASRPILFVGPSASDTARILRQAGCGYVFNPGDTKGLEIAIETLKADPELCSRMGRAGRAWFLAHYSRTRAGERFIRLLEGIVWTARPGGDGHAAAFREKAASRTIPTAMRQVS
jgi:glycosyltransferase involved in cell wall biosynthesis